MIFQKYAYWALVALEAGIALHADMLFRHGSQLSAAGCQLRIPRRAQKDNYRRNLHPDQQPNYRSKAAVNESVGHLANVRAKCRINSPPEQCRDNRSGQHSAKAAFFWARDAVDDRQREHRQKDQRRWK